MSTMKAIQFSQVGGVEVLEFKDVPRPSAPLPGTILVQNKYAGVNFIDTYHRTGLYKVQLPFIPGRCVQSCTNVYSSLITDMCFSEGSGVVEAVGDGVTEFKVGDRVAYMAGQTYAEYTTVKLPDNVSFEDGAALLLQGATAMSLVLRANEVKPGDFVLIHAAAGGTGRLLTQVCKNLGAFVIGTTSTAEKAATAKACGADVIINYSTSDVVEEVKRVTGGKGVHVVYDGVGRTTFETSLACLRRLGTMASFGNASGKVADVDIMKLVPRAVKLMRPSLFEFIKDKEDFDFLVQPLMKMMNEKKLNLHIHKIYDIKDSANAHVDLEGRSTQGKLILKL
ncbi:hypothetical protein DFJ73DRAFT_913326 [Zopfochytrium polystomum]|nr:hypothetical protein DFJ73DRAFT_913326 [Zopfochytrium polystomum]